MSYYTGVSTTNGTCLFNNGKTVTEIPQVYVLIMGLARTQAINISHPTEPNYIARPIFGASGMDYMLVHQPYLIFLRRGKWNSSRRAGQNRPTQKFKKNSVILMSMTWFSIIRRFAKKVYVC